MVPPFRRGQQPRADDVSPVGDAEKQEEAVLRQMFQEVDRGHGIKGSNLFDKLRVT